MRRSWRFDSEFSLERLEMKLSPTSLSLVGAAVAPISLDDPLPTPSRRLPRMIRRSRIRLSRLRDRSDRVDAARCGS